MKTCPYCAEEIQDAAIKCRHCGSMLAADPGIAAAAAAPSPDPGQGWGSPGSIAAPGQAGWAAMPTTQAGAGAGDTAPSPTPGQQMQTSGIAMPGTHPTYTHSGYRFVLGYDVGSYAIWDRQAPSTPVRTFPRTDAGWAEAWRAFAAWEPQIAGVSTGAYRPSGATNGMAVASLILALCGLFFLVGIGPILALVFGYQGKRQIRESNGAQTGDGLATAGIVIGWIGIAFTVVVIISMATGDPYSP